MLSSLNDTLTSPDFALQVQAIIVCPIIPLSQSQYLYQLPFPCPIVTAMLSNGP